MNDGELSRQQIEGWVANRFAYQEAIPIKDAAILSNCPDVAVRRRWIRRITDHDGHDGASGATGHGGAEEGGIEAWVRLGEACGVPREEMLDHRHVVPGVRFAVDAYVTFARTKPWVVAVASSLTELFAPDLMANRLAAFEKYYTWIDPDGLQYFRNRLFQAPRDSEHALEVVLEHCRTPETEQLASDALAFKNDVLWAMMDAIDRAYPE
jgi:pyrroloquinoline-quinone synthase